jgi:thymidine kinase
MKMYFFYGVMNASKTANALMKKFSFERCGKKVLLVKPSIDSRDGEKTIKSRVGLSAEAIVLSPGGALTEKVPDLDSYDVIIADEAQFFTENQIEELRVLADMKHIVMCYGLKTDFRSRLFEGSKRLLELADCIREIPTSCGCGKKAIFNTRVQDGRVVKDGEQIDIGGDEKYIPMCPECYRASFISGRPVQYLGKNILDD